VNLYGLLIRCVLFLLSPATRRGRLEPGTLPTPGGDHGHNHRYRIHPNAIQTWSVIHFIDRVRFTARPGQIDLLRVFGHGTDGEQNVAGGFHGKVEDIARDADCCIMFLGGLVLNKWERLQTLRDRFSSSGSVQLHGCHTGRGAKGRSLCLALARLWNVPVSAAYEPQFPDNADAFEGKFITATPAGGVHEKGGGPSLKCVRFAPPADKLGRDRPLLGTHTVGSQIREQDWLSNIAKKWYGDMLLWPVLFDFNQSAVFSNPNHMKPGQAIMVPSISDLTPDQRRIYRQRGLNWR
jgi:hypothetical protein